jgi:hypothetical protein
MRVLDAAGSTRSEGERQITSESAVALSGIG